MNAAGEWVLRSARLPEIGEPVLATYWEGGDDGRWALFVTSLLEDGRWSRDEGDLDHDIVEEWSPIRTPDGREGFASS